MKNNKTSRRKFLKRSAQTAIAALTFPNIIPSSVLGKSGTIPPSERITMGFIGVGGMGTGDMKDFLEKRDAHVIAVCDVDRDHRNIARDIVNKKYGHKNKCRHWLNEKRKPNKSRAKSCNNKLY